MPARRFAAAPGKRRAPACKGGSFGHGRHVRNLSDRGERRGAEHLVACRHYRACDGAGIHDGYRAVHGREGDIDAANYYFKKLNKITLVLSVLRNALILAVTPLIVRHSAISPEAKELVIQLVLINNIFNALAYPFAGPLGNGLRAAGDVKFTMVVSIVLTVAARLLFSAMFGLWLGRGVIGIAVGMSIDLVFRGAIFILRQRSQRRTRFRLI